MNEGSTGFDVVVVGGGMTGATLALATAGAGLRTALVEAQPLQAQLAPEFDGRASAIAFANMRQWRALGVAPALEAEAQPITSILVTDGPEPGASARAPWPVFLRFDAAEIARPAFGSDPDAPPEPLGWMVENRRIRAALADALTRSEATVFAPAEVAAVKAGVRSSEVRLRDGRVLCGRIVVGAEGRRSTVRDCAGIGVNGWTYPQAGVVATVALEAPHDGVAHEYFLPGGPLAILPLSQQRASLVWTEREDRAQALVAASREAFEAHLARRFGSFLGRPRLLGDCHSFPLGLHMAETLIGARTALIGDAAHAIHPIAGQGLNLGLKDAAALAEVLVEAQRLGEDIGSPAVLDRYARWRRFDAAALALATDLFTRLFSNDNPALRLVRGAGLALVNRIAPARRAFMREAGGSLGDMPRLLRGEPL